MSPHVWSVKSTFELIILYEKNVALWNATNQDFKSREAKDLIISNIATHMNVPTREIHRKLHNLRNQVIKIRSEIICVERLVLLIIFK